MVIRGYLRLLIARIVSDPYLKSFCIVSSVLPPFNCRRVAMRGYSVLCIAEWKLFDSQSEGLATSWRRTENWVNWKLAYDFHNFRFFLHRAL
jgi:hypothetical protein